MKTTFAKLGVEETFHLLTPVGEPTVGIWRKTGKRTYITNDPKSSLIKLGNMTLQRDPKFVGVMRCRS